VTLSFTPGPFAKHPYGAPSGKGESAQAHYDLIVVGAGLAGMFAGALAARRGARTLVIARGLGGTHVGAGTADVWGYSPHPPTPSPVRNPRKSTEACERERGSRLVENPEAELAQLPSTHPLALAGADILREALAQFQGLCESSAYPLQGNLQHNHFLPTALGAVRPACLAPESFIAGEVRQPGELTLARLPGFRDFYADLAVANLRTQGYAARAITLELPRTPARRDLFATDIARWFDTPAYRAEVAQQWHDKLQGVARLGLPAILGLDAAAEVWRDLSDKLGVRIFEIPILPPSVPGMRLFNVLRSAIETTSGRVTIGPSVSGWVENGIAVGVIAETAGGARRYAAEHILLATGGFRHGGLESPAKGQVRESVFNLPVVAGPDFFAPLYWEAQPYARSGVRVNEDLHPLDAGGEVLYPNVFVIGGLLAGADRLGEGSREGIDLATSWKAVNGLNGFHG